MAARSPRTATTALQLIWFRIIEVMALFLWNCAEITCECARGLVDGNWNGASWKVTGQAFGVPCGKPQETLAFKVSRVCRTLTLWSVRDRMWHVAERRHRWTWSKWVQTALASSAGRMHICVREHFSSRIIGTSNVGVMSPSEINYIICM
jgi:hypothetical protein